jgi:hypothetical protein
MGSGGDRVSDRKDANFPGHAFRDMRDAAAANRPTISDEVADKLDAAAQALDDVAQLWRDEDQAAFDASHTRIRDAFGFSLEEVAATVRAFIIEAGVWT